MSERRFTLLDPEVTHVDFSNRLAFNEDWNIIEYLYYYNGAGVAAGDIDNDGLIDLFFTSNEESNRLYRNLGGFQFEDITESAGVASANWSTGVTLADVNADGWLDIYVCQVGNYKNQQGRNLLYLNNADGTFTENAAEFGLDFSGLSTQAAFFDYDADGDLDMYLLNHSVHSVESYAPASARELHDDIGGDRLYENRLNEPEGRFVDVGRDAGIYSSKLGYGLGVAVLDYNRDGWPDLYISNDFHEKDYLYHNNADGTFREISDTAFGHTSRYSMGNDAADLNHDGYPEIISLDMLPGDGRILRKSAAEDRNEVNAIKAGYGYAPQQVRNVLQHNWGSGTFSDIAPVSGIFATDWSWAPLMADFDLDGRLDIYITNGIARRPNDLDYIQYLADMHRRGRDPEDRVLVEQMPELKISNYMFSHASADVTKEWGLEIPSFSNGSAYADLDRDGDLDIVVNNIDQPAFIFENNSQSGVNHSLTVRLESAAGNTFGAGAQVSVYAGGTEYYAMNNSTRGFMSAVPPELFFGLGQTETVDSMVITWPDQTVQQERNVPLDTVVTVRKKSSPHQNAVEKPATALLAAPAGLEYYRHRENLEFRDYQRERLIPENLSMEGPAAAVADINGDGRSDVFLGGAHGQVPALLLQQADGEFIAQESRAMLETAGYEDTDALFFDADADGDQDLYVVSGGNEYPEGHFLLQDRLYLNNGDGTFAMATERLPGLAGNGSVVCAGDFDGDGDQDLFVGNRSVPGSYGAMPNAVVLVNTRGVFAVDSTFALQGMVTDARWLSDNRTLVVVGDWMPVTTFSNTDTGWVSQEVEGTVGLWRSVAVVAEDSNGFTLLAGNMGLNTPLTSGNGKVALFAGDFDKNGQLDPVILFEKQGQMIPFAAKNDLDKQVPLFRKDFVSYESFSAVEDFPAYLRGMGDTKETWVDTFAHVRIRFSDGTFTVTALPEVLQWTMVDDIAVDGDQVAMSGNSLRSNVALGQLDAVPVFVGVVSGEDVAVDPVIFPEGGAQDVRRVLSLNVAGEKVWLIVRNNASAIALNR